MAPSWRFALILCFLALVTSWGHFSPFITTSLLAILIILRWLVSLKTLTVGPNPNHFVLESISASHFVEKVRWCLDRLGVKYEEKANAGIIGIFFRARTVPRLFAPTGRVISSIGNSADILRYLWGRYQHHPDHHAQFLEPLPKALEWEKQLDQYGPHLQAWFYAHCLNHRRFTLRIWGCWDPNVPFNQRFLLKLIRPLLAAFLRRAFRIKKDTIEQSSTKITALLAKLEAVFEANHSFILGGDHPSFIDFSFAALSGIWIFPDQYGNGRAEGVRPQTREFLPKMLEDMNRWQTSYPKCYAFICDLYRTQRT